MSAAFNQTSLRFRETEDFLRRFVVLPTDHAYVVSALWAMHSHVRDASGSYAFDYTPRLAFLSEGPGSGKTVALALMERLSHNGQRVTSPTALGVVRMINELRHTVCIDEVDELFGATQASKKDLRSILNSGYESGGMVARAGSLSTCFGPLVMAGMGANFATADSLRALRSRTIAIWMRKADPRDTDALEVYRRRVHDIESGYLHDALEDWGTGNCIDLVLSEPSLPDGVDNRDRDLWTPLLAIGELAGGDIAERSHGAVRAFVLSEAPAVEMSLTDRLCAALGVAFTADEYSLPTAVLVDRLRAQDPYWSQLWPDRMSAARGIARALRTYGVAVTKVSHEGRALQGYRLDDLAPYIVDSAEISSSKVEVSELDKLPIL